MPQPSWSTLIKHQLVTATVRTRQGGHTVWGDKQIRKLQCFDAYQPTLSAQLRRGVPTSIQKVDRVVLIIVASGEKREMWVPNVKEPWVDIEFQSLWYQRPKVVTKPNEQRLQKRF